MISIVFQSKWLAHTCKLFFIFSKKVSFFDNICLVNKKDDEMYLYLNDFTIKLIICHKCISHSLIVFCLCCHSCQIINIKFTIVFVFTICDNKCT